MKFLHLGDLHLGKTLGDFDLIPDQKYILESILEIIKKESADAVLIAGDVYDRSVPSEAAIELLDDFLSRLASNKVKTYMISGNHDSDDRLNFGSRLFESNDIFISSKFDGHMHKYVCEENGEKVNVFLLPFVKASQVKHFYEDEKIETYDDAVRAIIKHTNIDEKECNILVAHQFVAGKSEDPHLAGSEGVGTQSVGLVEKIGYDCFDIFDYVALGHIHSPQKIYRETIRYSGSPLKYSLSEVNDDKSVPVITVMNKEVEVKKIPLRPKRDLRHIKGKMEVLLDKKNITDTDDLIYATLTDEDTISDVMGIFQQVYPNTVKIDYDNSHSRQVEQVDISDIAGNKTFSALISEFYSLMYGCEISEEELAIMKTAAREVGIADETD
ncbi:MAG: exonuclease SbcCD subunit D [Lachnospiraceae bacterium]|nr:exonuclease SbcCD subunit D [Lachnospiraceae bacterium]